jgi:hypothetical protein
LQERALFLSLKYEFVTPLTSLVVVKPDSKEKGNFGDADDVGTDKIVFRSSSPSLTSSSSIVFVFGMSMLFHLN